MWGRVALALARAAVMWGGVALALARAAKVAVVGGWGAKRRAEAAQRVVGGPSLPSAPFCCLLALQPCPPGLVGQVLGWDSSWPGRGSSELAWLEGLWAFGALAKNTHT